MNPIFIATAIVLGFCFLFRSNPLPALMLITVGAGWIWKSGDDFIFIWIGIFIIIIGAIMGFFRFRNLFRGDIW